MIQWNMNGREDLSANAHRLLSRLSDATRALRAPHEIVVAAMRVLREHLAADRCAWAEVEDDENHFTFIGADVAPGVPTVEGRYPVSAFGAEALRVMRSGRPFTCADALVELPAGADREAYRGTGIRALIAVPLHKGHTFVAGTGVHMLSPREWTPEEVYLVQEVTERCWESIERARTEHALRISEARFRGLADAMPQMVWITSSDGHVSHYNRKWYQFTGLAPAQTLGLQWIESLHPDDRDRTFVAWTSAVHGRHLFEIEHRIRGTSGTYRWFLSRALPVTDGSSADTSWFGTSTDIEDHKRTARLLEDADRRKNHFLATLAHELRNPLAPIRNAVQILSYAGPAEATSQTARDVIDRQVQHMVRLIDDLLDVSRITQGKLELRSQRVELSRIIDPALEISQPCIDRAGLVLTVSRPPQALYLDADPVRLSQVLSNLLDNACKHTDAGGRIVLTVERDRGFVQLEVADTGTGIAPESLPGLFEMFSQVSDVSGRSRGGLGIGLSLARGLVEMHGGTIEAHSEGLGRGSRFVVRLPAAEVDEVPARVPDGAPPELPRSSLRILVVDDNHDSADSLAMLLQLTGADVETAYDGLEGVAAAERLRPDVVLLDIGMPGLDGYEACRRIRQQAWGQAMLVVAQTGWGSAEDRRRTREAGFDAHLVKPVDPERLLELLASRGAPAPPGRDRHS